MNKDKLSLALLKSVCVNTMVFILYFLISLVLDYDARRFIPIYLIMIFIFTLEYYFDIKIYKFWKKKEAKSK